eukprot:3916323-Karenia_brevis.AAC.1
MENKAHSAEQGSAIKSISASSGFRKIKNLLTIRLITVILWDVSARSLVHELRFWPNSKHSTGNLRIICGI